MNTLDYVFFGIIGIAAIRCWFRGIIAEILSAAALIGAVIGGVLFYKPAGAWLSSIAPVGGFAPVAGFVASALLVFIVVKIVEKSLKSVLENLNLDVLDRIFGLAFGALEGLVVVSVVLILLRYQPFFNLAALLDGSIVARTLLPLVAERIPPEMIPELKLPSFPGTTLPAAAAPATGG